MALDNGSLIEIGLTMRQEDQTVMNVWQYKINGSLGPIDAPSLVDAWWGAVQGKYRACVNNSFGPAFFTAKVTELNVPDGAYAEYSIPTGERTGTRNELSEPDWRPSFTAAGVRLTVGSRVTRPGQKRFAFLLDHDSTGNSLYGNIVTLLDALMVQMTQEIVLAAPSLGTSLKPIVVRKDPTGFVTAHQPITHFLINPRVTTQNSRKAGRGV